jgi:2,3,4,5-tetrahydropyridine-2-carboxylate N-succinyltransferase
MSELQSTIENIYQDPTQLEGKARVESERAIRLALEQLDRGELRVAEKQSHGWVVHEWVKKAILLYFKIAKMEFIQAGDLRYHDKIPLKNWADHQGVRVVPGAIARFGAFVEGGVILMPSFVNIGARVGAGTMVDTWATVGSCAQIGARVHLSGGVGIGGVLEPLQATPVIIEDDVFVGSRAIVVEGMVVEQGAVIGAGVTLTASTRIVDVTGPKPVTLKGRIPARSVVIPGSMPKEFAAGTFGVACALIIGQRSAKTDQKTSLTDVLREFEVAT